MKYKYDKLPNNDSFRIFELKCGKDDERPEGTLRTYLRKEAPEYEALSYVWGSPVRDRHMECNNREFEITSSLDLALKRLRLTDDSRFLWIDQICIDQTSTAERSEQVSIMKEIYSGATLVTAWLGPADANEATSVGKIISTLADRLSLALLRRGHHFPQNVELAALRLPSRDSPDWVALNSMLSTAYFSRVWILQELAVAPTYNMLWGDLLISKKEFNSFTFAAIELGMARQDPRTVPRMMPPKASYDPCPALEINAVIGLFASDVWNSIKGLFELVSFARPCHATDPRDKIFALVGLAGENTYGIVPDYYKTESGVFAEFASRVISETRNLEILNHSDVEDPYDEERLPLWAPTWHHEGSPFIKTSNDYDFKASNGLDIRPQSSINTKVLELKGLHVDIVKGTCKEDEELIRHSMAIFSMVIDHENLWKDQYGPDMIRSLALTMVNGRLGFHSVRPTDDSYLRFFTAFAVRSFLTSCVREDSSEKCQKAMIQLIRMAADACPSVEQNPIFKAPEAWEYLKARLVQLYPEDMETTSTYLEALQSISCDLLEDSLTFLQNFAGPFHNKFFITEKGYIGRGPCTLEPGDSVCILFGGVTPYILRAKQASRNEYLFLGNTYVHGIMEGEAIKAWEEQKDSQDPEFQERLFKLF